MSVFDGLILHEGFEALAREELKHPVYQLHDPDSGVELEAFVVVFQRSLHL